MGVRMLINRKNGAIFCSVDKIRMEGQLRCGTLMMNQWWQGAAADFVKIPSIMNVRARDWRM